MLIKPLDFVIIIISLFVIALFLLDTIKQGNDNTYAKVEVEGKAYLYPLNVNKKYKFTGSIGETTIDIHDGEVAFIDSPCSNKTCIDIGYINSVGESSACLPNRVLITIDGNNDSEVDVVSF